MDVANGSKEGNVAGGQNTQGITVKVQVEREMGASAHSSILVWRIPRTGEPGGLRSIGSKRVRHD